MGESRIGAEERRARFKEGDTVYIVTGRNNLMHNIYSYAVTLRKAADLWANDGGLNDAIALGPCQELPLY